MRLVLTAFLVVAMCAASDLAKGRFLVADRSLAGSGFAKSVVLLIRYDESGAMGLVVNRPTSVRVDRLLQGVDGLEDRNDVTFIGGPVETYKVFLLLRSSEQLADSAAVIDGVQFGNSMDLISAAAMTSNEFRVYAGYAGWGPGQLDGELEQGAWHVLPASEGAVFDANAGGLWDRLISRTEVRIAGGLAEFSPEAHVAVPSRMLRSSESD